MGLQAPRIRKRVILGLVCVFLLLIVGVRETIAFVRWSEVKREFASVQAGQTRIAIAGKPGMPKLDAGRCGVIADAPPGCASEFVYGHPLAP